MFNNYRKIYNMKEVKFEGKLQLNKETIANLNNGEMKQVVGGGPYTVMTICKSCIKTNCVGNTNCTCLTMEGVNTCDNTCVGGPSVCPGVTCMC